MILVFLDVLIIIRMVEGNFLHYASEYKTALSPIIKINFYKSATAFTDETRIYHLRRTLIWRYAKELL
jgi:hypothetical protein